VFSVIRIPTRNYGLVLSSQIEVQDSSNALFEIQTFHVCMVEEMTAKDMLKASYTRDM
jgi:hypothetical protein